MTTRAQLRTRAETKADQSGSDFPSLTEKNDLIDEAAREVFGDLLLAGYHPDFTTKTIAANNAASYPLAATGPVFSVIGVWFQQGAERFELHRVNEGARASLMSFSAAGSPYGYSEYYDLRVSPTLGVVIEFLPRPVGGVYLVDYIPDFPGFTADADTWFGPARSDDMITYAAAREFVSKEGRASDAQRLQGNYDRLLEKVQRQASWLDQRNPAMIRDAKTYLRGSAFDYRVEGPYNGDSF